MLQKVLCRAALVLLCGAVLALCCCSPASYQPSFKATPTATAKSVELELPALTPAPTVEPPVESFSKPALLTSADSLTVETPAFYQAVQNGEGLLLYAFVDEAGTTQYRLAMRVIRFLNGVEQEQSDAFYPAAFDGKSAALTADAVALAPNADRAGTFAGCAFPSELRLRRGYAQTEQAYVYEKAADGSCLAYGTMGTGEAACYPADADGLVMSGALPSQDSCTVPSYTPTDAPKREGLLKLVVYIKSQSVVAFRAIEGEWIAERVMICSTGRTDGMTPRGTYSIQVKYEFKRLGSAGNYCYGQYACRFTGPYLFHSVPISFDADNDPALGRHMMYMEKYELLGTPASDGCVRLTVEDAKWIYDNSEIKETRVLVTDAEGPVPPVPPKVIYTEPYTDANGLGWDPTDPDPENPYRTNGEG